MCMQGINEDVSLHMILSNNSVYVIHPLVGFGVSSVSKQTPIKCECSTAEKWNPYVV